MEVANWISIIDILVTVGLGLYISSILSKKQDNSRATKEYFIVLVTEFNRAYDEFLASLMKGTTSSEEIKAWFKTHTMDINVTSKALNASFKISFDTIDKANAKFKQYITDTEEFNEQYRSKSIKFKPNTQTEIIKLRADLREEFHNVVITINKK